MAKLLDSLKAVGSWVGNGASRAVNSFLERDRRVPQRQPGIGSALFSTTLAGSSLYGYPGNWSSQRINQVLHFRHWSYIAIRAIMTHVSGLTPNIAWVDEDAGFQKSHKKSYGRRSHHLHDSYLRQKRYEKSNRAIRAHEEVEMVGANHPLARLLEHPNELDSQGDLYAELVMFLKLTGNAYLWVVPSELKNHAGTAWLPAELWVIPSHWVHPRITRGQLPAWYDVVPFVGGGGSFRFPADEVIKVSYKNPVHKFDGYSPQTAGSEWIDCSESINTARFWAFKNGVFPIGSLELPEGYAEPSDQELDRIYAKFFSRLRGESRFGHPIIPPPGAKYTPIMIKPEEMAFPESADQMMRWCLALWGVPPEIAGIQEQGAERAAYGPEQMFRRHTLDPDLRQIGTWLTRSLAHRYDEKLRLWFDATVEDDPADVRANITLAATNGAITPNEIRTILLHLEPYAQGGDNPLVNSSLAQLPFNGPVSPEIQQALANQKTPAAPAPASPAEKLPLNTPEQPKAPSTFGLPTTHPSNQQGAKSLTAADIELASQAFLDDLRSGAAEPEINGVNRLLHTANGNGKHR